MLVFGLRPILFDEADCSLENSTRILELKLASITRDFYGRSELMNLNLSMACYRRWIIDIDQIIFITIFDSKVAVTSACKIDPLDEWPDLGGRRIQIDSLLRFGIHEGIA